MQTPTEPKRSTTLKQTFRAHRKLLSLPLLVGMLVAAYFVVAHKPSFTSTASLWVDTAPPVASSVGASANSVPLNTTPAAAEQGVLAELLATQHFALSVARHSLLGHYLAGRGPLYKTAPAALEAQQVTAIAAGPQVLQITYKGPTRAVTTSALAAIVAELEQDGTSLTSQHEQQAVSYYAAQVSLAQRTVAVARSQAQAYLLAHPHASSQTDPNLSALTSSENASVQQLAQANTALGQAAANRTGPGWLVQVIDHPSVPQSLALRKSKMLETILAGLFGGALVSLLGTIALAPRRREAWEDELFDEAMFADSSRRPQPPRPEEDRAASSGPEYGRRFGLRRRAEGVGGR